MESTGASVPEGLWCTTLLAHGCVHQPEALWTPFFRVSNGGPITSSQLIKSLAVVGWAPYAGSVSSPEVGVGVRVGGAESPNLLITWLVTSSYHLESPDNINSGVVERGLLWITIIFATQEIWRLLEVLCHKPRPYTCVFLYHNITTRDGPQYYSYQPLSFEDHIISVVF